MLQYLGQHRHLSQTSKSLQGGWQQGPPEVGSLTRETEAVVAGVRPGGAVLLLDVRMLVVVEGGDGTDGEVPTLGGEDGGGGLL